jgi:hypothetical protein
MATFDFRARQAASALTAPIERIDPPSQVKFTVADELASNRSKHQAIGTDAITPPIAQLGILSNTRHRLASGVIIMTSTPADAKARIAAIRRRPGLAASALTSASNNPDERAGVLRNAKVKKIRDAAVPSSVPKQPPAKIDLPGV